MAASVLVLPALLIVLGDGYRRAGRFFAFAPSEWGAYTLSVVESAFLWGGLLLLAARRKGSLRWFAAAWFVVLATIVLGGQRYFYDQFGNYMNLDAALLGASVPSSVMGQARADGATFLHAQCLPFVVAVALVVVARRTLRPRKTWAERGRWFAAAALLGALCLPCSYRAAQAATPDLIFMHALGGVLFRVAKGGLVHVTPGLRAPQYVPPATPDPHRTRNVLMVVTESVRSDAVCVEYDPDCKLTPFTNAALPDRFPLLEMRATASTTAISVAVLWSGLSPSETREAVHTAPLLFDYARAAGFDGAYWTSQNLMFANARLFVQDLPVSHRAGALDLDDTADINLGAPDELLTERAERELPELTEPWLAVVQYSNTHFPYRVDDKDEPFLPATTSKAQADNSAFINHYRNAVFLQDRTIAALVRAVRTAAYGDRTAIVFTSDHGEAFREHGQLGHTVSVFDEELRVPAWIDIPKTALLPSERAALLRARSEPTFHVDITPTVLDLMGLWDAREFGRFRDRMSGTSLLRPERTSGTVPLTNCAPIWGCAFRNWGLMRGTLKLEAREWDPAWHCWDVAADPAEQHDRGPAACGDLADSATKIFGVLPHDSAPMPMEP